MELAYLYIPDYKIIKDREYNFSNRYRFKRALDGRNVVIEKISSQAEENALWTKNFFGELVSNISIIVGENGTGKSTLLRFINEELSIGGNSSGFNFVAIFQEEGKFYTKSRWSPGSISYTFLTENEIDGIGMIQFYPLSDLTFKNSYFSNQVGSNRINVSDNSMILDDFERELGLPRSQFFQTPLQDAISPFTIANRDREAEYFRLNIFNEIPPAEVLVISTIDVERYINNLIDSYEQTIKAYDKDIQTRRSFEITLLNLQFLRDILSKEPEQALLEEYKFARALTFMLFVDIMSQLSSAIGSVGLPESWPFKIIVKTLILNDKQR